MPECVKARRTALVAGDASHSLPRADLSPIAPRGAPRWLLLPPKDVFPWSTSDIFPHDGKETYGMSERGWNMRCGQLIYLRGRPDIRFVELRFKSARTRRTGRYSDRDGRQDGRTRARASERQRRETRARVARRPVNRLSLHRHESRGGPYWPLKKRRFSL